MILSLIISLITCFFLILFILKKPVIRIENFKFQSFWVIALIGALLLLLTGALPVKVLLDKITVNSSINPIKILVLFISISFISISLDELEFFSYISVKAMKSVKNNQYKLFFILHGLISLLTVFTSNDIVILTFTPFICYFAKKTNINPIPYLVMEFINANTYSMLLSIGNPTNIYLSQSFNISFIEYIKIMALPTLFSGLISLAILLLLFNKELKKPLGDSTLSEYRLKNKAMVIINIIHLALTTLLLALSNYINVEMWIISLGFALSLSIFLLIFSLKKENKIIVYSLKRLPLNLIPFLLSMLAIVTALDYNGVIEILARALDKISLTSFTALLSYGTSSILFCNIINNIPMTVFYSSLINQAQNGYLYQMIFSSIAGSNVGAYLTPIGALAGIMWMSILKEHKINYSFLSFIKYGIILVPFTLAGSLLGLLIIL